MKLYIFKLIFTFLAISLFSCSDEKIRETELEAFIAPDAILVVKFNDYNSWKENLKTQSFLSKQKKSPLKEIFNIDDLQTIIELPDEAILSYNVLGKDEAIKTIAFQNREKDSLLLQSKISYEYEGFKINELSSEKENYFIVNINENNILSNSKIILENVVRNYTNDIKTPIKVSKLLNGLSEDSPSVILRTESFSKLFGPYFKNNFPEQLLGLSDYLGFDLKIDDKKIFLGGIVFNTKQDNWSVFKNIKAKESLIAEVLPKSFVQAKSILVSDYYTLYPTNKATEKPIERDSLLNNIIEVADIQFSDGFSKVFVSENIEQTYSILENVSKPKSEFSSIKIREFEDKSKLGNILYPFLKKETLEYFIVINDFLITSDKVETLENIIIQVNNGNVLANDVNYENHMEDLYSKSHMLWFVNMNQDTEHLENVVSSEYLKEFKALNWEKHELIVSQFMVENSFAYLNILQKQTPKSENLIEVDQQIRIKHDKALASSPQFFKNWRTGQIDLVYQDTDNFLHLKDTKGNLIWSKKLESRIVGDIFTIDIYQNKRLQLVFTTENSVYVIDKNGNDVSPFPLKSKDNITQSLSVFDYDNNGKYRFVVVMDDKVRMYDKKADRVRGFKFNRSKDPIAYPLKHIRMGNKDYIVAQENSGKLNILNRRGKDRIKIAKDFRHTENPWFEHKNKFLSVNDKGDILEIDGQGKISTNKKNWLNAKFDATAEHFAEMSENKLIIDNNTIELPFGLYTKPIIMTHHVGIADIQTQKIYIYDFEGNLLNGFPTFGEKINDYYYQDNSLILLCQDEDDALLVYRSIYK